MVRFTHPSLYRRAPYPSQSKFLPNCPEQQKSLSLSMCNRFGEEKALFLFRRDRPEQEKRLRNSGRDRPEEEKPLFLSRRNRFEEEKKLFTFERNRFGEEKSLRELGCDQSRPVKRSQPSRQVMELLPIPPSGIGKSIQEHNWQTCAVRESRRSRRFGDPRRNESGLPNLR